MIILFCGIPGSGKTTVSTLLAGHLQTVGDVELVNSDKVKGPVYPKLLKAVEPEQRTAEFLILDATFYKKEWREQVKAMAQPEKVLVVFLDCPLNIALERNKSRDPKISVRAVHIMYHRMERPDDAEIVIDTDAYGPEDAAAKIFDVIRSTRRGE